MSIIDELMAALAFAKAAMSNLETTDEERVG